MRPNFVSAQFLGIAPKAGDKEDMMNFLKWLQSLGEGISFLLPPLSLTDPKEILGTAEESLERGYGFHGNLTEKELVKRFKSCLWLNMRPQWLTLPKSDIHVQFQNWSDAEYVIIMWMSTLLQFREPKRSEELAQNAPDLFRLAKAAHLKYKPLLTIVGPKDKMATPYNTGKPRLYADWVTIIGSELLRRRKITLPKAPDTLLVEDFDGDVMISSKLSYADFVKHGFSEEEKEFWKSIGATIRHNPKAREPKKEKSETYIVAESPRGCLYLEPLDRKKHLGEENE